MKFELKNKEQWQELAEKILPQLGHPLLLLRGDLGAGKTTFTQVLLKNLGSKDEVSSPTYSIVNEYDTPKGTVYHFDLYRLRNIEEAYDLGIEEYLENSYLCIIEWPEIYAEVLHDWPHHSITIEVAEDTRYVAFS